MNILQVTEKKSVVYLCISFYFLFLCGLLLQPDSSHVVGFGFVFLWLISLFTKNIVLCVTGSFVLTCSLLLLLMCFGRGEGFANRCNPTCTIQNRAILSLNADLQTERDGLKKQVDDLTGEKATLQTESDAKTKKITGLETNIGELNTQKNDLTTANNNLNGSLATYKRVVGNISGISNFS